MNKSMAGKDAIAFLRGRNSLLDSTLASMCIQDVNGEAVIEFIFRSRAGAEYKTARVTFCGILEFGFYYSRQFAFYNVEAIKFLVTKDGEYYLSTDPDDSQPEDSEEDQDFVRAKNVEVSID